MVGQNYFKIKQYVVKNTVKNEHRSQVLGLIEI